MAARRMCSNLLRVWRHESTILHHVTLQRSSWRLMSSPAAESNSSPQTSQSSDSSTSAQSDTTGPAQDALAKAEEAFKSEREKFLSQVQEIQDKYKRSLAETENVRQRMQKQVDDAKLFGIQGFCKDMLEVADILSKATEVVPKDQISDDNPHLKTLYEGLTMTENQLQKVFTKNGLHPLDPAEGEKFDPNIHEALFQAPAAEGKVPGTVAVVTKQGYKLHHRTLRPALVGVYKEG